jgi:hypothetical protein
MTDVQEDACIILDQVDFKDWKMYMANLLRWKMEM